MMTMMMVTTQSAKHCAHMMTASAISNKSTCHQSIDMPLMDIHQIIHHSYQIRQSKAKSLSLLHAHLRKASAIEISRQRIEPQLEDQRDGQEMIRRAASAEVHTLNNLNKFMIVHIPVLLQEESMDRLSKAH